MASPQAITRKLTAHEIVALSDEELDRYLEESIRSNGCQFGYVDVDDLQNQQEDFIQKFKQRLRDRAPHAWAKVRSHPVDLDQVAERLLEASADKEPLPRSPSPASPASTPPLPSDYEEKEHQAELRRRAAIHNALIEDGGRPLSYQSILTQFSRWQDFRRLQRFARGQSVYDYWRSEWEDGRRCYRIDELKVTCNGREIYTEEHWDFHWQHIKKYYGDEQIVVVSGQYRPWEQFVERGGYVPEQQGFPEYVEALRERLVKYEFTRTFQLDKDPDRQDKLTTWIEYLGYEYWWLDQFTANKNDEERYGNAWKKLVDSNVLRVFETEDFVLDPDSGWRMAKERENAEKEVESAKLDVMWLQNTISDSRRFKRSLSELRQRLLEAEAKLKTTVKEHDLIKRRNDLTTEFCQGTRQYRINKEKAEDQSILLRWLLQEVPLIELELNPKAPKKDLDEVACRKKLKRGRTADLDEEEQSAKKQRHVDRENTWDSDCGTHTASTSQRGERPKRSKNNNIDDRQPSKQLKYDSRNTALYNRNTSDSRCTRASARRSQRKVEANNSSGRVTSLRRSKKPSLSALQPLKISKPVRRSARVVDREKRLCAAIEAQSVPSKPHQRNPEAIQMPTPPSSTDPRDRNLMSSAIMRAKNARAKRMDRHDIFKTAE